MLGLDPLYVANEGKCLVIVPAARPSRRWRRCAQPLRRGGGLIGEVCPSPRARSDADRDIGGSRIVHMLTGEMLPRIC